MGSKGGLALLVIVFMLLLVAKVVPVQIGKTPSVNIPPNFEKYSEELAGLNVTDPFNCSYLHLVEVTCHPENEEELSVVLKWIDSNPHGDVNFNDFSNVLVIPLNGSFFDDLPPHCAITLNESGKFSGIHKHLERARVLLRAYQELYGLLTDPRERSFIEGKINETSAEIHELESIKTCNATETWVNVEYSPPQFGGIWILLLVWGAVLFLSLFGIIKFREKGPLLGVFLILIILSSIFIGTYLRTDIEWKERERAMDMLKDAFNGTPQSYPKCGAALLEGIITEKEDALEIISILERANATPELNSVERTDGEICVKGYTVVSDEVLSELERELPGSRFHLMILINGTEFCSKVERDLRLENRIIKEHLNDLSPESREVLTELFEKNSNILDDTSRGVSFYELNVNICSGPDRRAGDFVRMSHTAADWGLLLVGLTMLIIATGKDNKP